MARCFRYLLAALTLLSFAACEKEDKGYTPPTDTEQTLLMYLPWSGNLTSFFERNIADMESVVASSCPAKVRVLVFFMESSSSASLFELVPKDGKCQHTIRKNYTTAPTFTTAEGIRQILEDVKQIAPAKRYAMTIGSHGMAWIPVTSNRAQALSQHDGTATEKGHWEYELDGEPLTRWFGGTSSAYQTDIATLAEGIQTAGMEMEFILFDDCYMASVEVAYDLREVTDYLIGSTSEIMAYGFPYALMGGHMLGEVDYTGICDAFYDFYSVYTKDGKSYPYGTISVIKCDELESLAAVVKRINAADSFDSSLRSELQRLDGYNPTCFFDMGDYFAHLCTSTSLRSEFDVQLNRTVPYCRHTAEYFVAGSGIYGGGNPILTFSGLTTSDPSINTSYTSAKEQTLWWAATH